MFGVVVALMIAGGIYYFFYIRSKRQTQGDGVIEPEQVVTERGLLHDDENVEEFK